MDIYKIIIPCATFKNIYRKSCFKIISCSYLVITTIIAAHRGQILYVIKYEDTQEFQLKIQLNYKHLKNINNSHEYILPY